MDEILKWDAQAVLAVDDTPRGLHGGADGLVKNTLGTFVIIRGS